MAAIKHTDQVSPESSSWYAAGIVAADMLAFLGFAAIGLASHGTLQGLASAQHVVEVATPFALGWFAVGARFGVFQAASFTEPRRLLTRTALAWLVACPVGLLLRALMTQKMIEPAFAIISCVTILLLLLGWRGLGTLLLSRRRRS